VLARVIEQEGVVAVRGVDLGVGDVAPVVEQRLDDLARARRREAPVRGDETTRKRARRMGERAGEVAAVVLRRVEVVQGAGDEQVGVGAKYSANLSPWWRR